MIEASTPGTPGPVDDFLDAIRQATVATADVWADGAVLDATVPNWRFSVHGPEAIRAEYGSWFSHPAVFDALDRTPLPDGELVEYVVAWEEHGVPHAAHHVHRLRIDGSRIVADTVFCGGRWPASLLAEMEEAGASS